MNVVELLVRFTLGGKNITFDVKDKKDADLLSYILKKLDAGDVEPAEVVVRYDEKFFEYLLKDRGITERTARDYMRYLRRLDGATLNYDLYLKISSNKWMVKTIRLYIDYLVKISKLADKDAERLLKIFRVKSQNRSIRIASIDQEQLVQVIKRARDDSPYRLVLELLYFSGARLSEVVRMIKDFNEDRLTCRDDEEFCRYYVGWYRGKKRCDYIYFPKKLLDSIKSFRGRLGKYETIRDTLFNYYRVKPKDYRKFFYRTCRELEIPKEVCNFYQSRVKQLDIGDLHYDDLTRRADKCYTSILKQLMKSLVNSQQVREIKT